MSMYSHYIIKTFTLLTIVVILFATPLLTGCVAPKNNTVPKTEDEKVNTNCPEELKPSELAQAIIKSTGLSSGRFYIPETHVISQSSDYESDETSPPEDAERISISQSEFMSDSFIHTLLIDHKTKRYWIIRMGGIAGSYERFGPFQFIE
jgi:hypothetical protein